MKCLNLDSLVVVECMLNVSCRMNIRPTLYFTKAIEWLINQLESHVNTNGGVNNPDWPKVHLKAFHLISTHYGNIDLIISKGGYRILLELCKSRVCHHQVYLVSFFVDTLHHFRELFFIICWSLSDLLLEI